jgi:hypothetical protein
MQEVIKAIIFDVYLTFEVMYIGRHLLEAPKGKSP